MPHQFKDLVEGQTTSDAVVVKRFLEILDIVETFENLPRDQREDRSYQLTALANCANDMTSCWNREKIYYLELFSKINPLVRKCIAVRQDNYASKTFPLTFDFLCRLFRVSCGLYVLSNKWSGGGSLGIIAANDRGGCVPTIR